VIYVTHNPKLETVESIKHTNPRMAKNVEKEGIVHRVIATNTVIFGYSKAKPSAAYDHIMMEDVVAILLHGHLSEASTGEAFLDGKRFPGGLCVEGDLLPLGLSEVEEPLPLFATMVALRRRRDGCAAQYQGKSAFLGWQSFTARNGVDATDCRNPSKHGKCLADGATMVQKGNIQRSAEDNYGHGTNHLVRHLAEKFPSPAVNRKATHFKGRSGLFSATNYVYIYYPSK
jgi:hypothetical protein